MRPQETISEDCNTYYDEYRIEEADDERTQTLNGLCCDSDHIVTNKETIKLDKPSLKIENNDDKLIDDYVDKRGCSYAEAYHHFGITEPETIIKPGVCVNLDDRAIALKGIMDAYNIISNFNGSKSELGFKNMINKYGLEDAKEMIKTKEFKKTSMEKAIGENIKTLMASKALKEAGFDEDTILLGENIMRGELSLEYGSKKGNAYNRKQLIKKIQQKQHRG